MTAWVYRTAELAPGDTTTLVLSVEVAKPAYAAMTDTQVATAISAQTEPDDGPVDTDPILQAAIETQFVRTAGANSRSIWGGLRAMAQRTWSEGTQAADHQKNDVIVAAHTFLAILERLEETEAPLVRGNTLWNSMDKALELLSNTTAAGATMNLPATSGAPLMTKAQADWMRQQGDRVRRKWNNGVGESDVASVRAVP
jgi:hypothetical protein